VAAPTGSSPVTPLQNYFADLDTRVTALTNTQIINVADVTLLGSAANEGQIKHVDEMNCNFQAQDGVWVQMDIAKFVTSTARDTAYAKAGGIYKVVNVQSRVTSERFDRSWSSGSASWKPDLSLGLVPIRPTSVAGTGVVLGADGRITFTTASSVSVNGCYSLDFENYLHVLVVTAKSAGTDIGMRLRGAGADITAANYNVVTTYGTVTSTTTGTAAGNTSFVTDLGGIAGRLRGKFDLFSPFLAAQTGFASQFQAGSANYNGVGSGEHTLSNSYDGCTFGFFAAASTMTGTLRIYGYNDI
jgi:hypothetical protein